MRPRAAAGWEAPSRRTCWLRGLASLLPAAGCSVAPRLQSPAAAGRDADWLFQENSRKNSGRYLKAQHPVCTTERTQTVLGNRSPARAASSSELGTG